MQLFPRMLAVLGLLLGLLALMPLGATAQEGPAPTIGELVLDDYSCETDALTFHAPVTDLPHIPNSNGAVGYSAVAYYDQGPDSSWFLPGQSYNVPPEDSPLTGNLYLTSSLPPTNADFLPTDSGEPIGSIVSIAIEVGVAGLDADSTADESSATFPVDCGSTVEPTTPPDTDLPAPTVGDIVVDGYDCDTGSFTFHVPVTDLPHIPDSNGSLGYSVIAHYDQGPDSSTPGRGYNVPADESPYTGTLTFTTSLPPTNEIFIIDVGSDEPVGTITSIDLKVGVGYSSDSGPSDTSTLSYPVDCGSSVEPTTPPVDPEPTEPDTGDSGELIPVCVQGFESTPGVRYLTQAQIDEIEQTWAEYDYSDIPPPQITGYPDPATGSCATENGVPIDYDPEIYTLICVPSGPEGDGPLIPQLAYNHYLDTDTAILADPDTGACSQGETPDGEESDGAGDADDTGDMASGDVESDAASGDGSSGAGTGSDDDDAVSTVSTLPSTGAGVTASPSGGPVLAVALGGLAALLCFAALRLRHHRTTP